MNRDFWAGRRVLVTGGTGFLGRHITDAIGNAAAETIVASRGTGVDLCDWTQCLEFFEEHRPSIVVNCAALQGGLRFNELRPGEIYFQNLLMGAHTMEAARRINTSKYVNIVAGCSYPGYIDGDLSEDRYWDGALHDSVVNYGITKKAQTIQGLAYKRQYGFDSIHLLMTNLYGPGEHLEPERSHALGALIRKFVEAVDSDAPTVEIWGTGRPVRDWMYVTDATDAIIRAAEIYNDVKPLNVATGQGCTIAELAPTIASVVGFAGRLVFDTSKPDGAMRKVFDQRRMFAMLGWRPSVTLRDGVERTVAYYRSARQQAEPLTAP